MRRIDKTIFNQLVSKRAVVLPNVGTLWVELINAEQGGGTPSNKVGFSRDAHEGVRSVIDIIHSDGVRYSDAEQRYSEWLVESTSENKLLIDGVGSITGNNFHVSKALNEMLNPIHSDDSDDDDEYEDEEYEDDEYEDEYDDDDYEDEDNYGGRNRTGLIVIGVLILILVGGWGWWWYKNSDRFNDKKEVATEQVATQPELSDEEIATRDAELARKVREEQKPAVVPMVRFYVVGGVFSTEANANRYIAETKRDFPHAKCNYQIQPFKGGKFMVSLFSGENQSDAANHRNRIAQEIGDYEVWVYEIKPTK